MHDHEIARRSREMAFALAYAGALIAYLFVHPERELLHWISLVALPLAALFVLGRYDSLSAVVASLGVDRARISRGWWLAAAFAVSMQVLQLLNRSQRAFLVATPVPRLLLLAIVAMVLLVGTAATTEEVFFRGIVQRRLANSWHSERAAALVATVIFAAYHVPYAYMSPGWQSAGDLRAALNAGAVNGLVGGIPLALVYWRSGGNLAAAIVVHAAIDLIPTIRLVDRMLL